MLNLLKMQKAFVSILFCLFLALPLQADTHTSVASGDWSDAATWDKAAVPADGDSVVIANTHTVIYDADMSNAASWPNGVTLTINAGGEMDANTAAGMYYLRTKSDITLNGALRAGTSAASGKTYMSSVYGYKEGRIMKLWHNLAYVPVAGDTVKIMPSIWMPY